LAGYFLAMMLARFAAVKLLRVVNDNHLVAAAGALAALATGLLLVARTPLTAAACAVLIGAAYAPIYPTTLGMAGDRFPRFAGTMFSVLFSIALIGGMTFPWAAGHAANSWGFRASLAIPLVGACGMTLMSLVILRTSTKAKAAAPGQ
jgi:fucose permease